MWLYNMYLSQFTQYMSTNTYMQARMLGILSPTSQQPLPPAARGQGAMDLRSKLDSRPKQLLVMNVEDRDQLTAYFEVTYLK